MYTHPPRKGSSIPAPRKAWRCAGTGGADQERSSVTCQRAVTLSGWLGALTICWGMGREEVRTASREGGVGAVCSGQRERVCMS